MVQHGNTNGRASIEGKPRATESAGPQEGETPPAPEEMSVEDELALLRNEKALWLDEREDLRKQNHNLTVSFQQIQQRCIESEANELKAWRRREEALEIYAETRDELARVRQRMGGGEEALGGGSQGPEIGNEA